MEASVAKIATKNVQDYKMMLLYKEEVSEINHRRRRNGSKCHDNRDN